MDLSHRQTLFTELMGRVLVIVGLAEGIAIYGVIISVLILNNLA